MDATYYVYSFFVPVVVLLDALELSFLSVVPEFDR